MVKNQNLQLNKLSIVILISLISIVSSGQNKKSFAEVDSTTYSLYLAENWNQLVIEGTNALKLNMDYYYLRMRIAYAYFQKKQYQLAISHYKKALEFNTNDQYAQSYLLNCYAFSGRFNDALKLSAKISENQLPELYHKYNSGILSAGVFYTFNNGKSNQVKQSIPFNSGEDGIQKATNYFHNTTAFLAHRLGKSITLSHTLDYLYKNEFAYLVMNNTEYEQDKQLLYQYNYNLKMHITPFYGFSLIPAINYIKTKIPIENSYNDYKESFTLYSLKMQQAYKRMNIGISYTFGELNDIDQNQYGLHLTWYPKANLNLYYSFDGYYQQQKFNTKTTLNFINKHLLGFKISNSWWMETSAIFPTFTNHYDVNSGITFNGLEGNQNMFNYKNIFLIKNSNTSFITNIGMYTGVSEFLASTNPLQKTNKLTYYNYNLSVGIIWKL